MLVFNVLKLQIKATLKDSLYNMINCMSCVTDFEQSNIHNRFVVKPGFIPELDESKVASL